MRSLLRDLVLDQKDQRARKASNGGTLAVTGALAGMGMADLSDVDLIDNPAADGQTLVWSDNEGKWLPQDAAGATALANLTDVDLATVPPTDGQTLVYDAGTGIWVPGDTGGGTLASLTDVDASSFQTGYTLVYSGSNWYATSRTLANLPDVAVASPADAQTLSYDATSSQWENQPGRKIVCLARYGNGTLASGITSYVKIPDSRGTNIQMSFKANVTYRFHVRLYAASTVAGDRAQVAIKAGTGNNKNDPSVSNSYRVYLNSANDHFYIDADSLYTWDTDQNNVYVAAYVQGFGSGSIDVRSDYYNEGYLLIETWPYGQV